MKHVYTIRSRVNVYGRPRPFQRNHHSMQPELVTNEHPESALRESRWFRAIFENATDGIMIAEVESRRMLFGNAAICWMLGRRPEEIRGLTLRDIHPESFLAHAERDFERHAENQGGLSENIPMMRKDGSIFYADITVAPVTIGAKRYLAGFFRDITERKLAEQLLRDREADLTAIVEHSPVPMLVTAGDGADDRVMVMNQAASDMLGYTLDDIPDLRQWWIRAYPDEKYREEVRAEWARRTASAIERLGSIEPMEATVTCKDGTTRCVRFSFASIGDRHILTGEDLTARRQAEKALRESEARYRKIFNAVYDVIYTIEPDGTLSSISPSAERMTGWRPEEWIGKHFAPVVHPDDQSRVQEVLDRLFAGEADPGAEIRVLTKSGAYLDTEFTAAMHQRDGSPEVVGVLRDISARKRAEEQVERLATTDELTGIANRREFTRILNSELDRARRYGAPLSLIMYDLDHFKRVNDSFGHDVGDQVLQEVARLVNENIRSVDTAGRWGGEEFMVLMPQTVAASARTAAEKLRQAIAQHRFAEVGTVTASFGVALFTPRDDRDSLLKKADQALYQAKARGRNRVEILMEGEDMHSG